MKKVIGIAVLIGTFILIGLINRENARQNTEAIEALPQSSTEDNIPRTRAELEALQAN